MKEENPFENKDVAQQWILSVESEKGMIRDNETYPALREWYTQASKGNILEIGSGQGICSSKIDGYEKYVGIEPSKFLIARAKELYSSPSRSFVIGNAYKLPVENESYDAVFSVNVWFHLENLEAASKELARVLRPGGAFFIHTADEGALDIWKTFYKDARIEGKKVTGKVEGPGIYQTTNIFYGHRNEEVIDVLNRAGLTVSSVTTLGALPSGKALFIVIEGVKI